ADVAALFASAARGTLDKAAIASAAIGFACNVVLASAGYPDAFEKGLTITGIDEAESDPFVTVYHAGTRDADGQLVTHGGRVLGVTATADTLEQAVRRSYQAVDKISFGNKYFRTDIAKKAL
ncbi:MAG: phosphoribosylglycinamide synthetase C domain-containing protein, partial [Ignavibacteria bacterium]